MKYLVRIGEREHEVVVDGDDVRTAHESVNAHIAEIDGTPLRVLTIGHEVHRLVVRRHPTRGRYTIWVGGNRFDVEALDERTRAIRQLSGADARSSGPAPVVAPMPGLVVRVNVREGDQVHAGQGVVVMEAMKMENELRASTPGTVRKVLVTPGTAVEKGTILLEMQ